MNFPKPKKQQNKYVYLDYAATTPVDPRVVKAMTPYWSEIFANPSALYAQGQKAHSEVKKARSDIANILHCLPREIIFTAGGTESNNLAIFGIAKAYQKKYRKQGHIIVSEIEHHSILHVAEALKVEGWKISYAPVDGQGFVLIPELKKLVRKDTVLISVMYANNEIGTIEPIAEIGKWIHGLNKVRMQQKFPQIIFHTDACQAGGALNLNTHELKVDLLTLNASKMYGPKQVAILYIRSGINLEPILQGGGQERNIRSGTENVPGIVGFAKAFELAQKNSYKENKRLKALQHYLIKKLIKKYSDVVLNGPDLHSDLRLANNINISFPGTEGETLMLYLDAAGIAVATGSACATTSLDPSHVLIALGIKKQNAYNAIRVTMGSQTTKHDLDYFLAELDRILKILKRSQV